MNWPVALLLAICTLFALAYVCAITAMLGLALSDLIARALHRYRRPA